LLTLCHLAIGGPVVKHADMNSDRVSVLDSMIHLGEDLSLDRVSQEELQVQQLDCKANPRMGP